MARSKTASRDQTNSLASVYDPGMWLYRAIGLRIPACRPTAVDALHLSPDAIVRHFLEVEARGVYFGAGIICSRTVAGS